MNCLSVNFGGMVYSNDFKAMSIRSTSIKYLEAFRQQCLFFIHYAIEHNFDYYQRTLNNNKKIGLKPMLGGRQAGFQLSL